MASIIICDGCLKHAPVLFYQDSWIKVRMHVHKGYTEQEKHFYEFHVCSQQCFNAVMRLNSIEIFE